MLEFVVFLCTVAFDFFARLDIMSRYIMGLHNNLTLNHIMYQLKVYVDKLNAVKVVVN